MQEIEEEEDLKDTKWITIKEVIIEAKIVVTHHNPEIEKYIKKEEGKGK